MPVTRPLKISENWHNSDVDVTASLLLEFYDVTSLYCLVIYTFSCKLKQINEKRSAFDNKYIHHYFLVYGIINKEAKIKLEEQGNRGSVPKEVAKIGTRWLQPILPIFNTDIQELVVMEEIKPVSCWKNNIHRKWQPIMFLRVNRR